MAKYKVLKPLSFKQGPIVWPGGVVELDDDTAAALLRRGSIAPAETQRRARKAPPIYPISEELDNGTDDRSD